MKPSEPPKITDPMKARLAVAEAVAVGIKFGPFPKDMTDSDWCEIANGLLKFFLDESAKEKIHFLFPIKRS